MKRSRVDPEREVLDLMGDCLWDVFSDNNDVTGPDSKVYHLGSFRGSGGFLADFLNAHYAPDYRYDYIDFYMGTLGGSDRANLTPVYEWIFRRLYALDCDWRYHFSGVASRVLRFRSGGTGGRRPGWLRSRAGGTGRTQCPAG